MSDLNTHMDAGTERLLEQSLARRAQELDRRELNTLARQTHASLARAIHPFHALVDGDVLYAVTTNEVANSQLESIGLGIVASELAWDAVLSAVTY